jgi:hypothetical protein
MSVPFPRAFSGEAKASAGKAQEAPRQSGSFRSFHKQGLHKACFFSDGRPYIGYIVYFVKYLTDIFSQYVCENVEKKILLGYYIFRHACSFHKYGENEF